MSDLAAQLRRIILMDDKIDRLGREMVEIRRDLRDQDRRLIRIETMIETAQARRAAADPAPDPDRLP